MALLSDAIQLLEGHAQNPKVLEAKEMLQATLKNLAHDAYEDRGTVYYYLLRTSLQSEVHIENAVLLDYLEKVIVNFEKQEVLYRREIKEAHRNKMEHKIRLMQCKAFYKLMERYFSSLEMLYGKKNFTESRQKVFQEKMRYRKNSFWFQKKYFSYTGYLLLGITSDYGSNFLRWGVTTVLAILLFGLIYWGVDYIQTGGEMISKHHAVYDYFYFSAVAFTTVGFGDITPVTALQKTLAATEALTGYLMIGMFLNLLQKRL